MKSNYFERLCSYHFLNLWRQVDCSVFVILSRSTGSPVSEAEIRRFASELTQDDNPLPFSTDVYEHHGQASVLGVAGEVGSASVGGSGSTSGSASVGRS